MKVHMKRKHTAFSADKFPLTCDLCDETVKCKKELKAHRLTHSYIEVKYKCADCEFVGENDESMHVHIGKAHSEKLECGLCEIEIDTLENLETHLITCEIYECNHCYFSSKNLSQMKTHVISRSPEGVLTYP